MVTSGEPENDAAGTRNAPAAGTRGGADTEAPAPCGTCAPVKRTDARSADLADVRGLETLGAFLDFELHFVTFGQRAEPFRRDRRVMHEDVRATILLDEAETLRVVEPLHLALRHTVLLLNIRAV